jgi:hypothetical protein
MNNTYPSDYDENQDPADMWLEIDLEDYAASWEA